MSNTEQFAKEHNGSRRRLQFVILLHCAHAAIRGPLGKCGYSGDVSSHLERRCDLMRAPHVLYVLAVTCSTNCVYNASC